MTRARLSTALGLAALVCAAAPASCAQLTFDPVKVLSLAAKKVTPPPVRGVTGRALESVQTGSNAAVTSPRSPSIAVGLAGIAAALVAVAVAAILALRTPSRAVEPVL